MRKCLGVATKTTLPATYPDTGRSATVSFRCKMITKETQRIIVNKRRKKRYFAVVCLCHVPIGFPQRLQWILATLKLWLYYLHTYIYTICIYHTNICVHMFVFACSELQLQVRGKLKMRIVKKKCKQHKKLIAHSRCVFTTPSLVVTQCQLHHYLSTRLVHTIAYPTI